MATQGDILTQVRTRLDERTENNWFDTEIRTWINEGVRDIARRAECCRTVSVVAMTTTQSFTLPIDAIRIHRVEVQEAGSFERFALDYRDLNTMDPVWWSQQQVTTARPEFFTTWGYPPALSMIVYPVPAITGSFFVYYYKIPAAMATATTASANSTIDLPTGWEDVLVDYVEIQSLRMDRDPRWQEAKGFYEERVADLILTAIRFNDQAGMMVEDVSGYGVPRWLWDENF